MTCWIEKQITNIRATLHTSQISTPQSGPYWSKLCFLAERSAYHPHKILKCRKMHTLGQEAYNGELVIPTMSFQLRCGCVGSSVPLPFKQDTKPLCSYRGHKRALRYNKLPSPSLTHTRTHMKLITACCLLAANLGVN